MNAHTWKQLISAYADGAVTPQEKAEAEQLLRERPECQAYLDELRALSSTLHVLKDQPLSPDAQMNILSNIKKERPMNSISWKPAAAIVSTVLVAVLVLNAGQDFVKRSVRAGLRDSGGMITDQFAANHVAGVQPGAAPLSGPATYSAPQEAVPSRRQPVTQYASVAKAKALYEGNASSVEQRYQAPVRSTMAAAPMLARQELAMAAPVGRDKAAWKGNAATTLGSMRADMSDTRGRIAALPSAPTATSSVPAQPTIAGAIAMKKDAAEMKYAPAVANGLVIQQIRPVYEQDEMYYPAPPAVPATQEEYTQLADNAFLDAQLTPLSTFSIDVDTASYSNMRRFLTQGQLPPKDAVRIEELVNYFGYDYPKPKGKEPFSITTNMAICPWNTDHQLVHIGLKGRVPSTTQLAASNLVFLIDVSGSMNTPDKLPIIKEGLKMMVNQLRPQDRISLVVYAGNAGLVLDSTPGDQKWAINNAIDSLQAGGSTAGGEGIALAYQIARQNFISGGNNRVVLATDGDFNVGITNTDQLVQMMEEQRRGGIFLTILGVGQANIKDNRMQQLADKGDGNYFYLDSLNEAQKVLVDELGSTLYTIAKDVKIQVEFNPAVVQSYRLIGYEKRSLAKEDFNNDRKDAGEIGAGHTVTALYEIVPVGAPDGQGSVDGLKYQANWKLPFTGGEVMTVKLRYKEPEGGASKLLTRTVKKADVKDEPTGDFAWAASVAEFGMLLRGSPYSGNATYQDVLQRAGRNMGADMYGIKAEFLNLVDRARQLSPYQQPNGNGQVQFK